MTFASNFVVVDNSLIEPRLRLRVNAVKPHSDTRSEVALEIGHDPLLLARSESSFFAKKVTSRVKPGLILDSSIDVNVKQYLADVLFQYAGALALYDVELASSGLHDPRKGILSLSEDGNVLSLDLSNVMWKEPFDGHAVTPIDAAKFRETFFEKAGGEAFSKALKRLGVDTPDELAQKFWGASDGHIIDRFSMQASDAAQGGTFTIAPRGYDTPPVRGDAAHVDVFVATTGNDTIIGTAGHDILVGEGGTDSIDAGAGFADEARRAANDNDAWREAWLHIAQEIAA
jgi:Ca2+-binding RTX toxin-like protein